MYICIELLGHILIPCLAFRATAKLFSTLASSLTSLPAMYKCSTFSTSLPTPVIFHFLIIAILASIVSHCCFDLHFPKTNDVEHLLMC